MSSNSLNYITILLKKIKPDTPYFIIGSPYLSNLVDLRVYSTLILNFAFTNF